MHQTARAQWIIKPSSQDSDLHRTQVITTQQESSMFALNNFIATSQHYFVAPMACELKSAAATAASSASADGFASRPRAVMLEQLTMAALVILSGMTLANALLGA
jgi:hypothetical protein